MWDMTTLTEKRLESNCSDITLVHKSSHEWVLIEIVVHWGKNIIKVEQTKIQKYQDLAKQI